MAVKIDGNGPITGSTNTVVTGMYASFMLIAAPAGWIAGQGQTMGSIGSGAALTGPDYLDLFTAWWAFTDVQLPILTSTGAASTRGPSALADWNALKRLTVFDVRDRVARSAGSIQANGTKLEATSVYDNFGNTSAIVMPPSGSSTKNGDGADTINPVVWTLTTPGATQSAVALGAQRVRVASIGMLGCFKL